MCAYYRWRNEDRETRVLADCRSRRREREPGWRRPAATCRNRSLDRVNGTAYHRPRAVLPCRKGRRQEAVVALVKRSRARQGSYRRRTPQLADRGARGLATPADFTAPNGLSLLAAEASPTTVLFISQMVDHPPRWNRRSGAG